MPQTPHPSAHARDRTMRALSLPARRAMATEMHQRRTQKRRKGMQRVKRRR